MKNTYHNVIHCMCIFEREREGQCGLKSAPCSKGSEIDSTYIRDRDLSARGAVALLRTFLCHSADDTEGVQGWFATGTRTSVLNSVMHAKVQTGPANRIECFDS